MLMAVEVARPCSRDRWKIKPDQAGGEVPPGTWGGCFGSGAGHQHVCSHSNSCATGGVWGVVGTHRCLAPQGVTVSLVSWLCQLPTAPQARHWWQHLLLAQTRASPCTILGPVEPPPVLTGQESWQPLFSMEGQILRAEEHFCLRECDLD